MTDDIEKEEGSVVAAEYTLGLLTPGEADAFEALMMTDPDSRVDYAFWADSYARLTDDIPEAAPPASLWPKIQNATFGADTAPAKQSWLERLGLLPAVGGGLLAAVVALWMINLSGALDWLTPPQYTAQIAAEDESLIVTASYDEGSNQIEITRATGAARDGRVLELWLIAGDNPPVSLGVLPEDQNTVVEVSADIVAALEGGVLAISDEPTGGSPTGAPTGDVLAVGPLLTL